jgi:hypothetical protein
MLILIGLVGVALVWGVPAAIGVGAVALIAFAVLRALTRMML